MKNKLLALLPIPALLSGLTACTTVHEHDYPPRERVPYHEPSPVYSEYDYYFYPNVAVYFQISSGFYFYEEHGRWVRVRQLPPYIYLDSRYRRHLNIRDPYPYIRYTEHARQYGARVDDRDRRDDRRPERDLHPAPPNSDRRDREPDRNVWQEREERRVPPVENRGQERREQVVPGRGPDDVRRSTKSQDTRKEAGPSGRAEGPYKRDDARRDAGKPDGKDGKGRGPDDKDDDDDRGRDRGSPYPR